MGSPEGPFSRFRPAWSPDGRKIAYVGMADDGNTDVYVVGADGRGQQRLTRLSEGGRQSGLVARRAEDRVHERGQRVDV